MIKSRNSLPIFIEELLNQGYRFVTIDELVRHGKKPELIWEYWMDVSYDVHGRIGA
jgi:hypothetical protein